MLFTIMFPEIPLCLSFKDIGHSDRHNQTSLHTSYLSHVNLQVITSLSLILATHNNLESSWRGLRYLHVDYHYLRVDRSNHRLSLNPRSSLEKCCIIIVDFKYMLSLIEEDILIKYLVHLLLLELSSAVAWLQVLSLSKISFY